MTAPAPLLLLPGDVSTLINCSEDTLKRWRMHFIETNELKGPAFVYLENGQVRYSVKAVNDYIAKLPPKP